ncbi:putative 33 kDa inner dynein arm light chain, axonemal [Trypanosoma theileri]|uniref:Putative 33 kDa inner dynein arm light chain, axonemal n=1 Tax=Trypanosoma theileri TaxID=67003 RepID=A0A1X0P1K7_9TRYP|nr:putative 33 kDa inner dynein arm light chain, axonemal [Trypanosoma theileri]ORC90573.1 putative 33 kDa inner dynein arm light chain, axonemal [Trypanosoma theileri]
MDSLLKLQTQVIKGNTTTGENSNGEDTKQTKRTVSIPVSRLADAKKNAATVPSIYPEEGKGKGEGEEGGMLTVRRLDSSHRKTTPGGEKEKGVITTVTTKTTKTTIRSTQQNYAAGTFINEEKTMWQLSTLQYSAASPAVAKAASVEESNNKGSLSYPGGAVLPALMSKLSDVERLLYTMLPPKQTVNKETGETIMQFVSVEPSSRVEVAELHQRLIQRLQERAARNSGICPIRREIYAEVFDELIREITLEEPVRGILLLRVRDELYQSLAAHRSLSERAMYYASKQRVEALKGMDELRQRITQLEKEKAELIVKRKTASLREEQLRRAIEEENIARNKAWQDELGYYRRSNRQLSQRIKEETERANAQGVAVTNVAREVIDTGEPTATTAS